MKKKKIMLKSNKYIYSYIYIHIYIYRDHSEWLNKSNESIIGTKGRANKREVIVVDDPEDQAPRQTKGNCDIPYIFLYMLIYISSV